MTGKSRTAVKGRHLAQLAEAQHGVVSRKQMRALGMRDGAIDHAIAIGRLHRVFRAVYALGPANVSELGRLRAAALACGKGAVISHRSAGALLKLLNDGPVVIDVIAPLSRGREINGIRFHRGAAAAAR